MLKKEADNDRSITNCAGQVRITGFHSWKFSSPTTSSVPNTKTLLNVYSSMFTHT